jgi:hypothetical protein
MKNSLFLTSVFALCAFASAQQNTPNRQMTPEMRARMAQFQSINDLAQDIRLLPELEKNKATALTKAQARQLLPILTALQKATSVQPNDAKKYLSQIEDKILTEKQLTALDGLMLKAEQQRAAQRAQRGTNGGGGQGQSGVRIPGVPGGFGGGFGGQRPGGQSVAGGQNAQGGQFDPSKFNPFRQGRAADALKAYIAVLQKK